MLNIGNRLECFFDDYLIDPQKTTAERRLHKPTRQKVLLTMDRPWEGRLRNNKTDTLFTCPFCYSP